MVSQQKKELDYYEKVKKQIDSNSTYAKKLAEEENNFGFKKDFDTNGNANLARRIAGAASESNIELILSEHDYVRSAVLGSANMPNNSVPNSPSSPTKPSNWDRPARPDKTPTKIIKKDKHGKVKKEQKSESLFSNIMNNIPLILIGLALLYIVYTIINPSKSLKGSKGKGKGKGKGKSKGRFSKRK